METNKAIKTHIINYSKTKTALVLRKLKDNDGNYLWNQANDTILGKQVIISEYMPDIETGTKPIAFGDFSYYWIVGRKPVTVRTLLEKFVLYDQIGYLAFERIGFFPAYGGVRTMQQIMEKSVPGSGPPILLFSRQNELPDP